MQTLNGMGANIILCVGGHSPSPPTTGKTTSTHCRYTKVGSCSTDKNPRDISGHRAAHTQGKVPQWQRQSDPDLVGPYTVAVRINY